MPYVQGNRGEPAVRPNYRIAIHRMLNPPEEIALLAWRLPNWRCCGYRTRRQCTQHAAFAIDGRCGRINLRLCLEHGRAFAERYGLSLPEEPGDFTVEERKARASGS